MTDAIAPLDDLDIAFSLPDNIEDERMRRLYEILVARMRREASHLSANTVQQLLIERIAYNYIVLRVKEAAAGTANGFAHATAQKEFNTFWLSMTQEFNKQLKGTDADFRSSFMVEIAKVVQSVIAEVPEGPLRARLRDKLAEAFDERGL
jgi:hypothetical protein